MGSAVRTGPELAHAFLNTVLISVLALLIALALGFLFGIMSYSKYKVPRGLNRIYVEIVTKHSAAAADFVLYAVLPLFWPDARHLPHRDRWHRPLSWSVHVRGGALWAFRRSAGQFEAAKSQGFTWETMRSIILPQAVRTMLPALAVQAANLIKTPRCSRLLRAGS